MPRPKGSLNKNTHIKKEVLSQKYIDPSFVLDGKIIVPPGIRCEKFELQTRTRCKVHTIKQILQPQFLLLLYTFGETEQVQKVKLWKPMQFPELLKTLGYTRLGFY